MPWPTNRGNDDGAAAVETERILLSPPDVGAREREMLLDAFDSNWIAPLGPHVDAFEQEFARYVGAPDAAALSSGTAALHLALLLVGVQAGDDVLVSTLTFVASANAVTYVGARPVFVDSEPSSWNIDPWLVAEELERRAKVGRLPAAVVAVDLYGQCADFDPLVDACRRFDVPLIEDAAEALGATYRGKVAGTLGDIGVFSFNGNKIITTSGGGMLVSHRPDWVQRARHLASQAREPVSHYEHNEIGFNYRLSNLLAAIGRAQLESLDAKVTRCRAINRRYRDHLENLPGIEFMPSADFGESTCWLTCLTIDESCTGVSRDEIVARLAAAGIEARPTWKPMHLQPLFAECERVRGYVAEVIFETGLCLPSGSNMADGAVDRVATEVASLLAT